MRKANTSFFVGARLITVGELVADDDPAIAGREHLFDGAPSSTGPVIESATAVPGEKRTTKRTAKKTSE